MGLGALVFEAAQQTERLEWRASDVRSAAELAALMRQQRVPLFVLEACQLAQGSADPTASVAGSLLQGGVAAVVAMSHSVLVETARRFTREFYRCLLQGERVGRALVQGQRALWIDAKRGRGFSGELELQDWFVPVLFQEEADLQLIRELPGQAAREDLVQARALDWTHLPQVEAHGFIGRSRALLAAERHLCRKDAGAPRYLVPRGSGGEGKTALAVELARWLIQSGRFRRCAFVSLEKHTHERAVLFELGRQLVRDFNPAQSAEQITISLEQSLSESSTLLILDNAESVLPSCSGEGDGAAELERLFALCERLAKPGGTRLVFTSREPLPAPFAGHERVIGRLERTEGIQLVSELLHVLGTAPHDADSMLNELPVEDLVEAAGGHARSLVLITPELPRSGVMITIREYNTILTRLDALYPGHRQRSLFASVELSLRRLPIDVRKKLGSLALFHGGGHVSMIGVALGLDTAEHDERAVARELIRVGLAALLPSGYLRLDPALGPYLMPELGENTLAARASWARLMLEYIHVCMTSNSKKLHSFPR